MRQRAARWMGVGDGRVVTPDEARATMIAQQLEARGIRDGEVLRALAAVPRERFVPRDQVARAYEDGALGIGGGQTISQPYMVARMTELLQLPAWVRTHPGERPAVLDVGTGSGYQAAVLAKMGASVTSIERDVDLADEARDRLASLDLDVTVHVGDGSEGFADAAPYAGIVVAAAAPAVPPPLIQQLADGGRLVIPIGPRDHQDLVVFVRRTGSETEQQAYEPCVFVPLVGRYGFPD